MERILRVEQQFLCNVSSLNINIIITLHYIQTGFNLAKLIIASLKPVCNSMLSIADWCGGLYLHYIFVPKIWVWKKVFLYEKPFQMRNIFFQTQSVHVSIYYLQWRDMIGVARDKSDKNMNILQHIYAIQQFLGVKGCNMCFYLQNCYTNHFTFLSLINIANIKCMAS